MSKPNPYSLIFAISLFMAGIAVADENENENENGNEAEIAKEALADQLESIPSETQAQAVLPAASEITSDQVAVASNTLVTQSGNTLMTAGTCSVIDDLVRQFCGANSNDISCQFQ